MSRKFPIKDRQYHEDELRKIDFDPRSPIAKEDLVEVTYHSSAINYLEYGAFYDIDGPAAEVHGSPTPIKPEFQLALDPNGSPFMRYVVEGMKSQKLERFDVNGVQLRDVVIRELNGKVTYTIPDSIDQGGAIRQFLAPQDKVDGKMVTPPVLKSDILEACKIHLTEGGISE